jgi:hypothetical protein
VQRNPSIKTTRDRVQQERDGHGGEGTFPNVMKYVEF